MKVRSAAVRVVLTGLLLSACASSPATPADRPALLEAVERGPAEERYHAVLALRGHDDEAVRDALRTLLDSEEALTRNAAARALLDLGETGAVATLVGNLHRDARTYATADAIHHLDEVFGTDLDYDPNLGYRHQTDRQRAWARMLGIPLGREEPVPPPDAALAADLETLATSPPADAAAEWALVVAIWRRLGEMAPSRVPAAVARVEAGFRVLANARPGNAALWNNHGLAALNNGHPETALDSYGRALELEPGNAQLRNDLGILMEGLGRLAEAEAEYRRAVEITPDDDIPWANLGDVLRKRGRTEEALAAYRRAERLAPSKWYYHRLWIGRLPR